MERQAAAGTEHEVGAHVGGCRSVSALGRVRGLVNEPECDASARRTKNETASCLVLVPGRYVIPNYPGCIVDNRATSIGSVIRYS